MTAVPLPALISPNPNCPGRVSERIYLYSLLLAGFPDFALWRKEAMSDGDVDAVTKDTGYGRVLGEIIRDWGVACAKRRAECLIKLVSIKKYLREPIISLNCLRLLCERGRATAPSGVLATLMGPKLPRELFVHVLSFWRSARALDDRSFDRVRGRYLPTRYDYWYCYEAPDEVIMG